MNEDVAECGRFGLKSRRRYTMDRLLGRLLIATAATHAVVHVAVYRRPLKAIWNDGIVNAVMPNYDRRAAVWSLAFAPVLFGLGQITNRAVERGDARILRIVAWNFLCIGVPGALLMPISGSWILLALVLPLLRAASRAERQDRPRT